MKGIILAGGNGTRLHPLTFAVNKQLLPVYDKPMIFYPLTTLIMAGIRDILLISRPEDIDKYQALLGDGSSWGVSLSYIAQPSPDGLAHALILGGPFIGGDSMALILGDNFFYGASLFQELQSAVKNHEGATIFSTQVQNPERYGVVSFDKGGNPCKIEEKPSAPDSSWAVTGLYFYDNDALHIAGGLSRSARGELEITDVNNAYLDAGKLRVQKLGQGHIWMDMGTHSDLLEASQFVHSIQKRSGICLGAPEEAAWRMKYIDDEGLARAAGRYGRSSYARYLLGLPEYPRLSVSPFLKDE